MAITRQLVRTLRSPTRSAKCRPSTLAIGSYSAALRPGPSLLVDGLVVWRPVEGIGGVGQVDRIGTVN